MLLKRNVWLTLYSASTTQPYVGCWVLLISSDIYINVPLGVWLSTTLGSEILDARTSS